MKDKLEEINLTEVIKWVIVAVTAFLMVSCMAACEMNTHAQMEQAS